MTETTILAVTRLSSGVCVAGITKRGNWVRPTRPNHDDSWRQLDPKQASFIRLQCSQAGDFTWTQPSCSSRLAG